jgi:hypothetical protein
MVNLKSEIGRLGLSVRVGGSGIQPSATMRATMGGLPHEGGFPGLTRGVFTNLHTETKPPSGVQWFVENEIGMVREE